MKNLSEFKKNIDEYIKVSKVDPFEKMEKPPAILEINGKTYGTLGNFSVLNGKAKSRKSFAATILAIATLDPNNRSYKGFKTKQPYTNVIYIDTEQSKYYVNRLGNRIIRKLDLNPETSRLTIYELRPFNPEQRLMLIERIIYEAKDVSLVIIDGIADLIMNGYNDETDSIMIASKLLKWTNQLNIHIITVIHQNKADKNAKGHLGSQLLQKAETVLDITKDDKNKDYSIITPSMSRGIDIDVIYFTIDDSGIPVLTDPPQMDLNIRKKHPKAFDFEYKLKLIIKAFEIKSELLSKDLSARLKHYLAEDGYSVGDTIIKEWITYYEVENMIKKRSERKPFFLTLEK